MGRGPGVRGIRGAIQIDFRYKGVRCRERLRLEPNARNLRFAANKKAVIEHEIAIGTFDYAAHFPRSRRVVSRSPRLAHHLDRFLLAARVSPETLDDYREAVSHVPDWLSEKPVSTVTQRDIENWLEPLNLSRKRLNNLLIPIRGTFRKAHRDGEIKINPAVGLRFQARATSTAIDPFTHDELAALEHGICGRLWKFWAWSGLRSGEIAGLEWIDVESAGDAIVIRRAVRLGREKAPKTRAGARRLVLLRPAREALGARGEGRVFTNPATGQPFQSDKQLRVAFQKACRQANVRYRYPYQLRHTFASWALSSGENPMWVAKQMGHKDISLVLRVYGQYLPELDPLAGKRMTGQV